MSVFVDTGVFYAQHDEDSPRHDHATAAMASVASGEQGNVVTSDYVYDETVTLVLSRFAETGPAITVGNRILGRGTFPSVVDLRFVERESFDSALDVFERYDDQGLSFTDATTIALYERYDIDAILSFDDDFDGLIDRLDPGEFV